MLTAIQSDNTYLFLHVDKRVDLDIFLKQVDSTSFKNLVLLPRFKSAWGYAGISWASMEGVKAALKYDCDYVIFLSGADYPIKSTKEIFAFLEKNNGKSFVDYYKMPAPFWMEGKEINRIRKYYFFFRNKIFEYPLPPGATGLPRKILNFFFGLFLAKERKLPEGIVPYGGEHWVCLHKKAVHAVVDFYKQRPKLWRFFTYCFSPEEIYIQTALFNDGDQLLMASVENQTITLINWKNKNNPSPAFFDFDDFDRIKSSDKLFARKFDFDAQPQLLERINQELLKNQSE